MKISSDIKTKEDHSGISVIVPVYNSESTITECINSIINQTYNNLQIICVNDGSTDHSLETLYSLKELDSRIQIVDKKNQGVSAARNEGIKLAEKEFITFVDADDTIEPTMYAEMIGEASADTDVVICGMNQIFVNCGKSSPMATIKNEHIYGREAILSRVVEPMLSFSGRGAVFIPCWNKIYRRSIIKNNALWMNTSRHHGEDWQFSLELYSVCNDILLIAKPLYNYIQRSNMSLVTKYRENFLEVEFSDRKLFMALFPELDWYCAVKINEYLHAPLDAAIHYRMHLSGRQLDEKLGSIYQQCFEDELFQRFASIKGKIWDKRMRKKWLFNLWLFSDSAWAVFLRKSKSIIKKCLQGYKL